MHIDFQVGRLRIDVFMVQLIEGEDRDSALSVFFGDAADLQFVGKPQGERQPVLLQQPPHPLVPQHQPLNLHILGDVEQVLGAEVLKSLPFQR